VPVKHVDVQQARDLQSTGEYTYVDVRSVPEYDQGHPAGAVNVPLMHYDERAGGMVPNPDFLGVMEANFPHTAKLLVGCQMGGRSAKAAELLAASGYEEVVNVRGGFGGRRDPGGRLVELGWAHAGLPVEKAPPAGGSYDELLEKA
jgi:rhodanese-related sulfurtransferase